MRTQYQFTLPIPAATAWQLLSDADRALGWVPGADITAISTRSCAGSLKLRVRSTSATYRGTAQLMTKDDATGVLAAQLEGSQTRGNGTLKADVEVTVSSANGSGTIVSLTAEFAIDGPVTEAGGAAVEGAVDRLLARFASNVQSAVEDGVDLGVPPLPPVSATDPAPPPVVPAAPPVTDTAAGPAADLDAPPAFAAYGGSWTRRISLSTVGRAVAGIAAIAGVLAAVRRYRRR
jgi:carbon monoxide dehydrogenase subunit G